MSARNDLAPFALLNLEQMKRVGSNKNVSIIVRLNSVYQNTNMTQTLLIEKNKITLLNTSGNSATATAIESLIDFLSYSIQNFPAQRYACFFWDHGTGILTPQQYLSNQTSLSNNNHSKQFSERVQQKKRIYKGVCFDDESESCFSDSDISVALATVSSTYLQNKKFDVVGFDACCMSMLEIAYTIAPFAHYMVASQELEPGAGWNYEEIFSLFTSTSPSPLDFVQHIVKAYKKTYLKEEYIAD